MAYWSGLSSQSQILQHRSPTSDLFDRFLSKEYSFSHIPITGVFFLSRSSCFRCIFLSISLCCHLPSHLPLLSVLAPSLAAPLHHLRNRLHLSLSFPPSSPTVSSSVCLWPSAPRQQGFTVTPLREQKVRHINLDFPIVSLSGVLMLFLFFRCGSMLEREWQELSNMRIFSQKHQGKAT